MPSPPLEETRRASPPNFFSGCALLFSSATAQGGFPESQGAEEVVRLGGRSAIVSLVKFLLFYHVHVGRSNGVVECWLYVVRCWMLYDE